MNVACVQLDIKWENQEANFSRVKNLISESKKKKAELICLPELFSTGVTPNSLKFAEHINGKTCSFLSDEAKKNEVYLLGSFIEKEGDELPKNTVIVYDPKGKLICKYQKNHVFSYGNEHEHYSNGNGITSFKIGEFEFCPFICYDLRFPEIFRKALNRGTNVFIISANWPNLRKDHWISLLKARAIENQSYLIGINRCGTSPELDFFGSSMIISPKGEIIAGANEQEQIVYADINFKEIFDWRNSFNALKDRREEYYSSLK